MPFTNISQVSDGYLFNTFNLTHEANTTPNISGRIFLAINRRSDCIDNITNAIRKIICAHKDTACFIRKFLSAK